MASIVMDFVKVSDFYESFNQKWLCSDMIGDLETSKFHIVLASDCDDVFENNIDSDGCLNSLVTVDEPEFYVKLPLSWERSGNNSRSVVISNDVVLDIGEPHYDLKGVFFTVDFDSKHYVIGYMILPYYLIITNKVTFPKDTVLVSVD